MICSEADTEEGCYPLGRLWWIDKSKPTLRYLEGPISHVWCHRGRILTAFTLAFAGIFLESDFAKGKWQDPSADRHTDVHPGQTGSWERCKESGAPRIRGPPLQDGTFRWIGVYRLSTESNKFFLYMIICLCDVKKPKADGLLNKTDLYLWPKLKRLHMGFETLKNPVVTAPKAKCLAHLSISGYSGYAPHGNIDTWHL